MAKRKAPSAKSKAKKRARDKERREVKKAEKEKEEAAAEADPASPLDVSSDKPEPDADPPRKPKTRSKLTPLREWNDKRARHWRIPSSMEPRLNGVACPKCGGELLEIARAGVGV